MTKLAVGAFFLPLATCVHVQVISPPCGNDAKNFRCVQYVDVIDGDTITVNISSVHDLLGKRIKVRVARIDAPEMRTKDSCEKKKGLEAKQLVVSLCSKAKRIDLEKVERGKYFRVVADVICDGTSLADALLNKGLAYTYGGGKKKILNWCKPLLPQLKNL